MRKCFNIGSSKRKLKEEFTRNRNFKAHEMFLREIWDPFPETALFSENVTEVYATSPAIVQIMSKN